MNMITNQMKLIKESLGGKLYETAGNPGILVPVMTGSYFEMGKQYGQMLDELIHKTYSSLVQPLFDKKLMNFDDAVASFVNRAWNTVSSRQREIYRGVVEGSGMSLEKLILLDQQIYMQIYQAKLHSFSGCSSIFAWDNSTTDGNMVLARNLDWSVNFMDNPQVFAVWNPEGPDHSYANFAPAGWVGATMTGLNDQGLYLDLHDGTSMGGAVVYLGRSPLINSLTDALAEVDDVDALGARLCSIRADISNICQVADKKEARCYENPVHATALLPNADTILATSNTFMNPVFGIIPRDTMSKSLQRHANLSARLKESKGNININKIMEIMDLGLYNPDGSPGKGATKPFIENQYDVDVTVHTIAVRPADLQVWLKVPTQTEWCKVDLKKLFNSNE
jgi:hypothetical protein